MNKPKNLVEYTVRVALTGMLVLFAQYFGQGIYASNSVLPITIKHCLMVVTLSTVIYSAVVLLGIPTKVLDSFAIIISYTLERFAQAGEGVVDATKMAAKNLRERR